MNPELTKKLYQKYPKIFADKNKSMQETCMCWGIECGDGWYHLLDVLCEALTYTYLTSVKVCEEKARVLGLKPAWTDDNGIPHYSLEVKAPQVVADQVKEKYGTLRFYYHLEFDPVFQELAYGPNPEPDARATADRFTAYMDGIVHMAETLSGRTCEDTGKKGEMHVTGGCRAGWYRTLNREHAKADPEYKDHNFIPVADIPKDDKVEM